MPESRARGYEAGRFSFNVKGGRCEACQGDGVIKVEMHFLADVYVPCDVCRGKRYNRETLEIRFKGKNIQEVLDMTVEDALPFFSAVPTVQPKLKTLLDVGLSYVRLGQSATTLSGGEAQRVKLAKELSKRATGRTLYILDEPTTGLHFADIAQLLAVLHRLRDEGNTIIVIEHNLDVIKTADWVVDLGPEGGDGGGRIIAVGTPEDDRRARHPRTPAATCKARSAASAPRPAAARARAAQARVSGAVMRARAAPSRARSCRFCRAGIRSARTIGVSRACSGCGHSGRRRARRPARRCVVSGSTFAHPLGLAAGFDKNGDYLDALGALGFSHIELGTVTPRPQSGNPKPRMFRGPGAAALVNRMGFNNKGVDHLVARLRRARYSRAFAASASARMPTRRSSMPPQDYLRCLRKVYALRRLRRGQRLLAEYRASARAAGTRTALQRIVGIAPRGARASSQRATARASRCWSRSRRISTPRRSARWPRICARSASTASSPRIPPPIWRLWAPTGPPSDAAA